MSVNRKIIRRKLKIHQITLVSSIIGCFIYSIYFYLTSYQSITELTVLWLLKQLTVLKVILKKGKVVTKKTSFHTKVWWWFFFLILFLSYGLIIYFFLKAVGLPSFALVGTLAGSLERSRGAGIWTSSLIWDCQHPTQEPSMLLCDPGPLLSPFCSLQRSLSIYLNSCF